MLTITSVLSLFTLLVLATGLFFMAKRVRIPYTVLLVLAGLVIVPLSQLPYVRDVFGFLDDVQLTSELLFYIFLPVLIFESGFNMSIRKMLDSSWTIGLLSIVGLLVSAFGIAAALYFVLPLIGFDIPFVLALLFGAIISATDPVAVLALFKEFGAPKRLTMIFEGESLFNDGTAVALFMVVLAVAQTGFHGATTVLDGVLMFAGMILLGVGFGLLMAMLFSAGLRGTKSNEFVAVTLLIVSAHMVFILAEMINHHGLFGLPIHISPIIATTVTSLFLGNYSRHILSIKTDEYLGKFIEHVAFIANSLVFILAGMLFASSDVDFAQLWLPILVTVLVVIVVRAISVYAVTVPLNASKLEAPIPASWQLLLSWGSLRGALAIIIVLLIPKDLAIPGWEYAYSPRDLILALTTGCILATLFIKAPLIGKIMNKLHIDEPEPLTMAHEADLGIYYLLTERNRLVVHKTRGFVADEYYQKVRTRLDEKLTGARAERDALRKKHGTRVFEQSLHMTAIQIERTVLKQLFINREITERVYRKLLRKLNHQMEKIEYNQHDMIDPSVYQDRKDIFDTLSDAMQRPFERMVRSVSPAEENLQYYRAQMIMARKAVKTLDAMQTEHDEQVFIPSIYDKIRTRYDDYRKGSAAKMDAILAKHKEELGGYLVQLAQRSIRASGGRALDFLHGKGIATETIAEEIEHRYAIRW